MKIENPQHGIVTFSADEQSLRSIGHDGVIADWKFPQDDLDESDPFVFGHLCISGNGKVFLRAHWGDEQPYKATFYDQNGRKVRETHIPLVKRWIPAELNHDGSKLLITHWNGGHRCISIWDCGRDELAGEMFRASETERLNGWEISPTESKVQGIVEIGEEGAPKRHELRIWDLDDSSMLRFTLDLEGILTSSSYAPDGKTIRIVTSLDEDAGNETDANSGESFEEMSVRDVRTGEELRSIRVPGKLRQVRMSLDGKQFAGIGEQGKAIEIWDLESGKLRSKIHLPKTQQIRLAFSPSGKRLLSMATSRTEGEYQCNNVVTVWDSATGTQLLSRKYFSTGLPGWMGFEFVGDQHRLWIASLKGRALFWNGTPVNLASNK